MIIFYIGIILIVTSFFNRKNYSPYWGFIFPLIIMGFQSNVQGDYQRYKLSFEYGKSLYSTIKETEFGWLAINDIFQVANFETMIFFIAFFQNIVLAYFIKNYTYRKEQWLGAVFFFWTFVCMLIQMKALRQGVAIEIVLLGFIFVEKSRYILALLMGGIAFSIHNSSIVILPVLLLFLIYRFSVKNKILVLSNLFRFIFNINLNKSFPIFIGIFTLLLCFFKAVVINKYLLPFAFAMEGENDYAHYIINELEATNLSLFIVVNYVMKAYFLALLYMFVERKKRAFVFIALLSMFLNLLFFGLGSLQRAIHYYTIFTIAMFPNIVYMLKTKYRGGKVIAMAFLFWCLIYEFRITIPWLTIGGAEDNFASFRFVFM